MRRLHRHEQIRYGGGIREFQNQERLMTTPNFEYDCYHCKHRCGGRTVGGYGAITGPDGAIHAACSRTTPRRGRTATAA